MNDLQKILKFLNKIEKLKTVKRAISISDNSRKESPAEHTRRVAIMAMIFSRQLKIKVDILKTIEIILVHDIIESIAWDIRITDKNDTKAIQEQKEKELKASKKLYWILPKEIWKELESLRLEYENWTSKEWKFAKALDKIEVLIQRMDLRVKNREKREFNIYEVLMWRADKPVEKVPELKSFLKLVKEEITKDYKKNLKNKILNVDK